MPPAEDPVWNACPVGRAHDREITRLTTIIEHPETGVLATMHGIRADVRRILMAVAAISSVPAVLAVVSQIQNLTR